MKVVILGGVITDEEELTLQTPERFGMTAITSQAAIVFTIWSNEEKNNQLQHTLAV